MASVQKNLQCQLLYLGTIQPITRALEECANATAKVLLAGYVVAVVIVFAVWDCLDGVVKFLRNHGSSAQRVSSAVDPQERHLQVGGCLLVGRNEEYEI